MITTFALKSAWPTLKNIIILLVLAIMPLIVVYLFSKAQEMDPTMGLLDVGIWQLLLLSVLSFLGLSTIAWLLLQWVWASLGLPKMNTMVSQFKTLTTCQQFAFYWASFALLLLAAVLSLVAVF